MQKESLKNKAVKGTFWSGIDNVSKLGVTFLVSIILARLLSPDDYGLIGIIAIFTAVCNSLIDGGFYTALIRKKDASDDDYNTMFIVNLSVSITLYVVIFACSPWIASFFERPELNALTRVSSLGIIAGAFSLVQQTRLTKRIDFKSQTKVSLVASIISGIIGIVAALVGFGVWSLVIQSLLSQTLRSMLLAYYNRWLPHLRFSSRSFHELFGFGWKMLLSGLINTVWNELYQVVIGKFYSPASLGQYTRSQQFSKLLSSNLTSVVQRVTYPVLSNIQDDRERMVSAYRRIIKMTIFVSATGMFFLGAISEPLLYCLIGPKWHEAAVYLPLICLSGSTYPLHAINLNMLQVQGRSDLFLKLEIAKKTIGVAPLMIGIFAGIIPMLCADLITTVIAYFLNSHYSGRLLGYGSLNQLKDIAPSYGVALMVAASVFFLKYIPTTYWIILPLQVIVGFLVGAFLCRQARIEGYEEILNIVVSGIRKRFDLNTV